MAPIPYIECLAPEWRNWQTRWTQNPVPRKGGVGSIPSSGTLIFPDLLAFRWFLIFSLS